MVIGGYGFWVSCAKWNNGAEANPGFDGWGQDYGLAPLYHLWGKEPCIKIHCDD
jgi:hypothetical protein